MTDHDQHFKELIPELFSEFLDLFFPETWAKRIDTTHVEWLSQEIFPDGPDGSRHAIDLLAKVKLIDPENDTGTASAMILVHIEIESGDRTTRLKSRLPAYYIYLRDKFDLPILPIVLYLKVGMDGIGIDTYLESLFDLEILRFRYLYVGLPGLDGIEYLQSENPLGVALSALMRIPREKIVELGAEAFRLLSEAAMTDQRRHLLANTVEKYLPLDAELQAKFELLLNQATYLGVKAMNLTNFEKGMQVGKQTGREEGQRIAFLENIEAMLEIRFGSHSLHLMEKVRELDSLEVLRSLVQSLRHMSTLEEFHSLLESKR
jgi:hypothetical protein